MYLEYSCMSKIRIQMQMGMNHNSLDTIYIYSPHICSQLDIEGLHNIFPLLVSNLHYIMCM